MEWNEWRKIRNEIRDIPTGNSTNITIWLVLGNPGAIGGQPSYPFNTQLSPLDVDWGLQLEGEYSQEEGV